MQKEKFKFKMKSSKLGLKSFISAGSNFISCPLNFKLLLWFVASLAVSLIFFPEFWASLRTMLSLDWIFGQQHASLWGILALCLFWLYLKRKEIWRGMNESAKFKNKNSKTNFALYTLNSTLGLGLVAGAVLMPPSRDFLIFPVLLVFLGVFVIFFGRAAKIPSILLAIYGFAISFPLMIERFAEDAYSRAAIVPLTGLMTSLGYPFRNKGYRVYFMTSSGEPVSVAVTLGCAGPATMGVFLAIFALMMLDIPLPPKKAVWIFLFGAVGTWFQSFVRLVALMFVGYYLGEDAMWATHFWSIYILFPRKTLSLPRS